jgi:hypothetical protein
MQIMSSKKKNETEREHRINFNYPKDNRVESNDPRLNELIAQSHLSVILKANNGGYPASKRVSNSLK